MGDGEHENGMESTKMGVLLSWMPGPSRDETFAFGRHQASPHRGKMSVYQAGDKTLEPAAKPKMQNCRAGTLLKKILRAFCVAGSASGLAPRWGTVLRCLPRHRSGCSFICLPYVRYFHR